VAAKAGRGGGKAQSCVCAAIMEHTVMNGSMCFVCTPAVRSIPDEMSVVARSEPLAEYQAERVWRGFQPARKRLQAQALSFLRGS
jgi:hypothetical protein